VARIITPIGEFIGPHWVATAGIASGCFAVLAVIIAITVISGPATHFARHYPQSALAQEARAAAAKTVGTIVVAAAPMQFGTAITEDKVSEVLWAAEKLPPGAFATKQEFFKEGRRIALSAMERDEPVLRNKITAPGQRGSLSTLIDSGMRAVTVPVDDVRGVAGFIQPNDRVDVVLIRTQGAANGQGYSDVILQNMKVLAIDQIAAQQVEKASVVVKAVTLEATPEEAQKAVLAQSIGRLSLILRQPIEGAGDDPARPRITEKDLGDTPAAPKAAPPPSTDTSVVINRGGKSEKYSVPRY
jgi:pilus assembly protein CpaB